MPALTVTVNGQTYTANSSLAAQFPSATSGMQVGWVADAPVTNYNHGVFVEDMDGADFHAKLVAGATLARTHKVPLVLPGGEHDLDEPWVWAIGTTNTQADLFNNMHIIGNGCIIRWTGSTNQAMFEMPSPNRCTIEGPLYLDGQETAGVIGMWMRAAWAFNRNGMRNMVVNNVTFEGLRAAAWVGDSLGPDFRPNAFRSCFVTSTLADSDGFVFHGANVTSQLVDNCSINVKRWGIHAINSSTDVDGNYFDGVTSGPTTGFNTNQITDPWNTVWGPDFFDSAKYPTGPEAWNARVFNGGTTAAFNRDGGSYGGDAEAKIIDGGPNIAVRNCDSAGGDTASVFAKARRCSVSLQEIRLEGSGDLYENTETWYPGFASTRFYTIIQDCTSSNSGIAINNQGGPPVVVRGGRYSTSTAISTGASATTILEGQVYFASAVNNVTETGTTVTLRTYAATSLDSSSNAITATLGSGSYVGQRKTIVMTDATNSSTVSVTNHVTSDPEVFTFDAVDEALCLEWTGTEWITIYATATT